MNTTTRPKIMATRLLWAVVLVLGALYAPASAQTHLDMKDLYSPYEPIIVKVDHPTPEDGKLTVMWTSVVPFRQVQSDSLEYAMWAPPGKHLISGVIFTTRSIDFNGTKLDVLIGVPTQFEGDLVVSDKPVPPGPGPGPNPVPPDPVPPAPVTDCSGVAPDNFANIGQRACGWASGLPKRKEVGALFGSYSQRITTDQSLTVNSATSSLMQEMTILLGADGPKWDSVLDNINKDTASRWPMAKGTLGSYWQAVSVGLKHGQ